MAFHVGQKVVCIADGWKKYGLSAPVPQIRPTRGQVYTVKSMDSRLGHVFLELREIKQLSPLPEWAAVGFRPLIERKKQTDISVFKEILERETIDAPVSDHQRERRTEPQRPAKRVVQ